MANSYSIGKIFNIPVRVHITLLIFLPLFAVWFAPIEGLAGLFFGLLGAIGLFGSVVLHEVGHSLVARTKGARILEILLLPIGGMAKLDRLPRRPADEIQTALAGPAVSFALGIAGTWAAPLIYAIHPELGYLCAMLGRINFMLAFFNLIPSFPMDGGRVFRAILTPRLGRLAATQLAAKVGRGFAWIFGFLAIRPLFSGDTISFTLLLIAFFVYQSAGAEARMAEAEAAASRQRTQSNGMWQIPNADVKVGPSPYNQESPPKPRTNPIRDIFNDFFKKWR